MSTMATTVSSPAPGSRPHGAASITAPGLASACLAADHRRAAAARRARRRAARAPRRQRRSKRGRRRLSRPGLCRPDRARHHRSSGPARVMPTTPWPASRSAASAGDARHAERLRAPAPGTPSSGSTAARTCRPIALPESWAHARVARRKSWNCGRQTLRAVEDRDGALHACRPWCLPGAQHETETHSGGRHASTCARRRTPREQAVGP
jgi:hypothetical protein